MILTAPTETLPTDNEFGIPLLREDMQGEVAYPIHPWGAVARTGQMHGTWHFYVDDYRFGSVLRNPSQVSQTLCKCAVEPNVSVFDGSPKAFALWATWQKRFVARTLQELGVRVLVDLCVPERFARVNLLGVPRGWRAYATRGFRGRETDVEAECALAAEHGGPGALVLVYGGGKGISKLCQTIKNAVFVEQFAETRRSHG